MKQERPPQHEREPLPPARVLVMRHAQSEANIPGGEHIEKPYLTPLGIIQADTFGELLRDGGVTFDAVYTSGRDRAVQTAQRITNKLGITPPFNTDARLREKRDGFRDRSHIAGGSERIRAMEDALPDNEKWDFIPPVDLIDPQTHETYRQIADRFMHSLDEIITSNPGRDVLIVSHAMVMSAVIARFKEQGKWPDETEGSVFKNSMPHNTGFFALEGAASKEGVKIEMFDYDLINQGNPFSQDKPAIS